MAAAYDELRILFDQYVAGSLKEKTREKRTNKSIAVHYHVNDSTDIKNMTNFLAHIKTKAELTVYLAKKLMEYYEHNEKIVIVTYDTTIACNRPLTDVVAILPMCEGKHSLEEADHQIVLHSIDIAEKNHNIVLDVYSLDTDVFVLLTAFYLKIPFSTTMLRPNEEKLSIRDSYQRLGDQRAEALIGWYAFKGTDNTGGFVSKALKSNFKAFLAADNDILDAFSEFGCSETVPERVFRQMERYVCLLYRSTDSKSETLKELRWALFAKAGKEGRQLPPTLGTLIPHTKRAYYHALVLKKSTMPCPVIPSPTNFSWIEKDGCLQPQQCTLPPAPEALVALRKCGCSKGCKTASCGCKKIPRLSCTDLCDCGESCHNRDDNTIADVNLLGLGLI